MIPFYSLFLMLSTTKWFSKQG